jgi:tryptophanase
MTTIGRILHPGTALPSIEPFRVKAVEAIRRRTLFHLRAEDVSIDLLTDSACYRKEHQDR